MDTTWLKKNTAGIMSLKRPMVYIWKFVKNNFVVFISILACVGIDLFLFYGNGYYRFFDINRIYFDLINNFPASIASPRVEPVFIIVTYFLSKILNNLSFSIIVINSFSIATQLFIFYKLIKIFIRNNALAIASVIVLNFSFAFFSIIDNLLRNSFANIFFLLALYYLIREFRCNSNKDTRKINILLSSVSGGLLIYAHILPALLYIFTLIILVITLLSANLMHRERISKSRIDLIFQILSFFLFFSFFINLFSLSAIILFIIFFLAISIIYHYRKNCQINGQILFISGIVLFFLAYIFNEKSVTGFFKIIIFAISSVEILRLYVSNKFSDGTEKKQYRLAYLIKFSGIVLVIALIIQSPYIYRMVSNNTDIGDYKLVNTKTESQTSKNFITGHDNIAKIEKHENKPFFSMPITELQIVKNFKIYLYNGFIEEFKIFRILFEYRMPGFSIFFMFLVVVSIVLLIKSKNIIDYSPIIILWSVTYFGSKADLITEIGTLPYRFSLMLVFSSLLLAFILLDKISGWIKNSEGKIYFTILIVASSLSLNLPLVIEGTVLRNYSPNIEKDKSLEQIYYSVPELKSNKPATFITNGDSFEKLDNESNYLSNDNIFSTQNENNLINQIRDNKINYIIYDHSKINSQGNDLGSVVNSNLKVFENSSYFKNLGEFKYPYKHLSIFEFHPEKISNSSYNLSYMCNYNDTACANNFSSIAEDLKDQILNWFIDITVNGNVGVSEYVVLRGNRILKLDYNIPSKPKFIYNKNTSLDLIKIPVRKEFIPFTTLHLKNDTILVRNIKGVNVVRKELQEYSIGKLSVFGNLYSENISYELISRTEFRFLMTMSIIMVLLMIYIGFLMRVKVRYKTERIFFVNSTKEKIILLIFIFFLFADAIILNTAFAFIYKKIIGL